jgi:hypothetical protein
VAKGPIYVALAVTVDGHRDILGLWAGEHCQVDGAGVFGRSVKGTILRSWTPRCRRCPRATASRWRSSATACGSTPVSVESARCRADEAQRGVRVSYDTIQQWCRKFGQTYANDLRRQRSRPGINGISMRCSSRSGASPHYL